MAERNITQIKLPFKLNPVTILIIIVAGIILIGLFSSFFMVGANEKAVVLFLGKIKGVVGPGLHFKLPFGIEKNYNVSIRTITQEFGFRTKKAGIQTTYSTRDYPEESIMLTEDKNIVDVEWTIQYQIVDPVAWLFNVEHAVEENLGQIVVEEKNLNRLEDLWYEKTIRDISQSVINQLVGDRTILSVIGNERTDIQVKAMERMNQLFGNYGMGIKVTQIALQDTLPPEGPVRDAFEDVNKAEQDKEKYINEGQELYNKAIPEEKGKAEKVKEEALGYAAERVNIARGDVARFESVLKEYLKAPDVTRTRLYIEMFEQVFKNDTNTDLIDRSLKNFIPFKTLDNPAGGSNEKTQ